MLFEFEIVDRSDHEEWTLASFAPAARLGLLVRTETRPLCVGPGSGQSLDGKKRLSPASGPLPPRHVETA